MDPASDAEELHEVEELQVVVQWFGNATAHRKGDVYSAKSVYSQFGSGKATTR